MTSEFRRRRGQVKHVSDLLAEIKAGAEPMGGWTELIRKLCEDILVSEDPVISQVKEKFGTLRFYVDSAADATFDLITIAEEASARTCEMCGKPGTQNKSGWVKTLCEEHHRTRYATIASD